MTQNQFNRIYSRMANEFGRIRKGREDPFTEVFFAIEGNALYVHRQNPKSNSRRMLEAIALVLWDVYQNCTGETFDTEEFRDEDNEKLEEAILMAFDPLTNEAVMEGVRSAYGSQDLTPELLRKIYDAPVKCLLRLKDSVELWMKQYGTDGYFALLERSIGRMVKGDDMRFALMLPAK